MQEKSWFDINKNKIVRKLDSGKVSYVSIAKEVGNPSTYGFEYNTYITRKIEIAEVYLAALKISRKKLTPELKQVIDDFTTNELNEVIGLNQYDKKTPLGHAIDNVNLEATQYLLSKGADTSIHRPHERHILENLLSSNVTDKRVHILELILDNYAGTIPFEKDYNGKYYPVKYLIPMINKGVITKESLVKAYDDFKPSFKKQLLANCTTVVFIAIEKGDEEFIPQIAKDLFLL